MIELRDVLHPYLKAIHPRIFFQEKPDQIPDPKNPSKTISTPMPYAVYNISIYDDGESTQTVTLEIDGWTDQNDTTELENLMKAIDNGINKQPIVVEGLLVVFFRDNKFAFLENETKFHRRRYSYTGYLHGRS